MVLGCPSSLLAFAIGLVVASPSSALCRLDASRESRPASAQGWMARADPKLVETLEDRRVIFPRPGSLEPCIDLAPALVLFQHPPAAVFRLLIQTERHLEFLPSVSGLEAVSRGTKGHVDRHEISIFFTRIAYHVEQQWSREEWRIWWRLSPLHRNDIRALEGYWELHALPGGRTLGLYGTFVDIGPVLPQGMQAALTRKNMRAAIHALREWVDENGHGPARGTGAKTRGAAR